jgi:hypothetical protein
MAGENSTMPPAELEMCLQPSNKKIGNRSKKSGSNLRPAIRTLPELHRLTFKESIVKVRFSKLRMFSSLALSLTTVSLLFFCGCGATSHSAPAPAPAPTGLTYSVGTAVYVQEVPITANSPASTGGAVTSYSATPPLPAGIVLNTSTGVISGTAIKATATTVYTITASNSAGSTTAPVTITVTVAAPAGLAYSTTNAFYTVGVPIPENVPTSTGGAPSSYTVSAALPGGLLTTGTVPAAIFAGTGIISGIPAAAGTGTYTVTASNLSGNTTTTLTITVSAAGADVPPAGLAYSAPAPVYAAGVPITPNAPSFSAAGGTPNTYSVSPALPGLILNPNTGIVTGTPTAIQSTIVPPPPATATYTVTASNAAGSTTAPLTITVYNAPQAVPNVGQSITPLATTGSSFQFLDTGMVITDPFDAQVPPVEWLAGYGASSAVSPDGNTLLVLTSGYNRVFQGPFPLFDPLYSSEYVFIYNIQSGAPVFQQAVPSPILITGLSGILPVRLFTCPAAWATLPTAPTPSPTPSPTTATMSTLLLGKETEPGRRLPNWTWAKIPRWGLPRATLRATAFLYSTAHSPR